MQSPSSNWTDFKALISTPDLPGIGPVARPGRRQATAVKRLVSQFVSENRIGTDTGTALLAAALLWHDHLDASHELSQRIETSHGSFLHGIMHRREPDYGNAKYWFHRVGRHPAFSSIAVGVAEFLKPGREADLLARLMPGDKWDPFAFVDACEQAATDPGERHRKLQRIQEIEFDSLLAHLLV